MNVWLPLAELTLAKTAGHDAISSHCESQSDTAIQFARLHLFVALREIRELVADLDY